MSDEQTFTEVPLTADLTARYSNYRGLREDVLCDLPGEFDQYDRVMLPPQLRFGLRSPIPGINLWSYLGRELWLPEQRCFRRLVLSMHVWNSRPGGTRQLQLQQELQQLGAMVRKREATMRSPGANYYLTAQLLGCDDD